MKKRLLVVLAAVSAMGMSGVEAQVTVGTLGLRGNCMPFGCLPVTRYQQVYSWSMFAPMSIDQIEFFYTSPDANTNIPAPPLQSAHYTFYLSATSAAVNGLSSTNLDDNVTAATSHEFFSGFLPGTVNYRETLSFFGSGFYYEPGPGQNLLLDIVLTWGDLVNDPRLWEGPDVTHFLDANQRCWWRVDENGMLVLDELGRAIEDCSTDADNFSRAFTPVVVGTGADETGLVTRFSSSQTSQTVVPEPMTIGLLATGLVGIAGAARRRRQRGVSDDC